MGRSRSAEVGAIVFDFDGVLVESVEVKTRAFARLFAQEPPEMVRRCLDFHLAHGGLSRDEKFKAMYRDILRRPLSDEHLQHLCDAFAGLVVDEVVSAPWVEGAREFLERHQGRYAFFVVSGTPEEELREIVRRRAMGHFFEGVWGSPRPKVVLLQGALRHAGQRPTEAVFVGDSQTDWSAAREVGMPFIWRCAPTMPSLDRFHGPRIVSLVDLAAALSSLTVSTGSE